MAEPTWNESLQRYTLQQSDGSWLITDDTNQWVPWAGPQQAAPVQAPVPAPAPVQQTAPVQAVIPQPVAIAPQPVAVAPQPITPQPITPQAMVPSATMASMMPGMGGDSFDSLGMIDMSDVEEGNFRLIPEKTWVLFEVSKGVMTKANTDQTTMLQVNLKVVDPPAYAGITVQENIKLNKETRWKFKSLCRCCNLLDGTGSRFVGTGPGDFVNKRLGGQIIHNDYNGPRNKVNGGFVTEQEYLAIKQEEGKNPVPDVSTTVMPGAPMMPGAQAPVAPMGAAPIQPMIPGTPQMPGAPDFPVNPPA